MSKKALFLIARALFAITAVVVIVVQRQQFNDLSAKLPQPAHQITSRRPASSQGHGVQIVIKDNPDLAKIFAMPDKLGRLRALLDFTAGLDASELRSVLEVMAAQSKSLHGENDLAMSILMARLVQLDPRAALNWANNEVKGPARRRMLDDLFNAWSDIDPAAALAGIEQIQNVSERAQFQAQAFASMASRDPQGALRILQAMPLSQQTHDNYEKIFTTWATVDPTAAAVAVLGLAPSRNRDFAIENVLQGWAQVDPKGALAWAATLPGGVRAGALSTALGNLAQQDPPSALEYLSNLPNAADRNSLMNVLASNWGKVDPIAALTWVDQNATGQAHDSSMLSLLGQLSQTDGASAATLLNALPERMQSQAITQIANNWAMQDIKAAMDWVSGLPGANAGNTTTKNLEVNMINNLTNADPARAAAYVVTIQDNPLFGRLVEQVAANWVGANPPAAFAWAQSLPPEAGGNNAMLQVITQYTNKDATAAWGMATDLPPGDLRDHSMTNVFGKWVALDPAKAAPQLANLPETSQVASTNALAQAWVRQDPQAAAQWINTLAPGDPRDSAVTQLISVEGTNDLPTAFTWAITIGNDATRERQIATVAQQWARKDPAAAAAAVQTAPLTPQQQASLLNTIQRISQPTPIIGGPRGG